MPTDTNDENKALDPLFINARRELVVSVLVFVVFGVWVIGVSWLLGRPEEAETIGSILGIPTWAFWGVAVPWVLANVFIFWFCFRFMADDDLVSVEGEEADES